MSAMMCFCYEFHSTPSPPDISGSCNNKNEYKIPIVSAAADFLGCGEILEILMVVNILSSQFASLRDSIKKF